MSSVREQGAVLLEALRIYEERARVRGDLWKRYGWRGTLHEARVAMERAWYRWFNAEPVEQVEVTMFGKEDPRYIPGAGPEHLDVDELLDAINYAAMAIRAIRDGNRDGGGKWWPDE